MSTLCWCGFSIRKYQSSMTAMVVPKITQWEIEKDKLGIECCMDSVIRQKQEATHEGGENSIDSEPYRTLLARYHGHPTCEVRHAEWGRYHAWSVQ